MSFFRPRFSALEVGLSASARARYRLAACRTRPASRSYGAEVAIRRGGHQRPNGTTTGPDGLVDLLGPQNRRLVSLTRARTSPRGFTDRSHRYRGAAFPSHRRTTDREVTCSHSPRRTPRRSRATTR